MKKNNRFQSAAANAVLGALLAHRENAKLICWTLLRYGWSRQDVQDGLQDVYVKALESFQHKAPPETLERMMALCSVIAKNHAIDAKREAAARRADLAAPCKRADYGLVEREVVPRDSIDAGKQLEVLADLFREGEMPRDGVDILEGVACGRTYEEIAQDLAITKDSAEARMRQMKKVYRRRMVELGMWPGMDLLRVVSSTPGVVAALREAA
jgi:DNA-directed RNA polymerase specialized sigma24 family protein